MVTDHSTALLHLHSGLRWLVLLSGFILVGGCVAGKFGRLPFRPLGKRLSTVYVSLMDLQFLAGIALSFASPLVCSFWNNPAAGMKSHDLRFFAVEHTTLMITALVLAHIGSVRSRRAIKVSDSSAYGTALKWFAVSLALILMGIPWWRPFLG
jgi:hypothetical protein